MSFRGSQFPMGGGPNNNNYPNQGQPLRGYPSTQSLNGNVGAGQHHRKSRGLSVSSPLDSINQMIPSDNPHVKKFEAFTERVEEFIDQYLSGAKPYVPAIGRFCIVATFLEDALRITTQWKEQVYYLSTYRHIWPWFVKMFLIFNIISMCIGSVLVIIRKKPEIATGLLTSIVFLQGIMYGLFFDPVFFLRNVSVIGGLLLALSDSIVTDKRSLLMPGLPMLESKDNRKYFLLAGRMMLIVLFLTFTLSIKWTFFSFFIILIGLVLCLSVAIGYKTKFSAAILTGLLMIHNIFTNHYWTYGYKDNRRDYLRYEFFQTLSIVGGLLLIVNTGAGELSIDEKKKVY